MLYTHEAKRESCYASRLSIHWPDFSGTYVLRRYTVGIVLSRALILDIVKNRKSSHLHGIIDSVERVASV